MNCELINFVIYNTFPLIYSNPYGYKRGNQNDNRIIRLRLP